MVGDESSGSTRESELATNLKAMKLGDITTMAIENIGTRNIEQSGSVNEEEEKNESLKKKKQIESEDIRQDQCHKTLVEDHRINGITPDEKRWKEKIQNLSMNASKCLLKGNARMAVNKFQVVFDEISKIPSTVFDDSNDYVFLKYAYCISLLEENNYSDILHALKLLQESIFSDVPIYHYAKAKILIKLNRFRLAENELKLCHDSMNDHDFTSHCWPGTKDVIEETTRNGLEASLNELTAICSCYHKPDAICKFAGCNSASTHPFPSREIYISDGDFKGYVVLTCQEGCKIQYHPLCWKNVKDAFSNLDKLSDKDCLGKPCMTPDCKNNDNEPSVIHKIEIFGSDANVKSHCELDCSAENKQKEIALSKKRQRLKSDEHKTEKLTIKNKPRLKKISLPDRSQSSDNIATSMKNPASKENNTLQICGITPVKSNVIVKGKESMEMINNVATQKEFICSYFLMLLNTLGPLSKQKAEEEWEKFYPNIKPLYGLMPESDGIFNLLKNSKYFVEIDDHLFVKESSNLTVKSEINSGLSNSNTETNALVLEHKPSRSKENAQIESEIKEIENELLANSAVNRNVNLIPCYPIMMPGTSLESARNEMPMMEKDILLDKPNPLNQGLQNRPFSFGFFDDKTDNSVFSGHVRELNKLPDVSTNKNPNVGIVPEYVTVPEDFRAVSQPVHWRDEGFDSLRFASPFHRSALMSVMREHQAMHEKVNHKEISTQTDAVCETKSSSDDELWVQHMQFAVNDLIKKNKDLVKSKEHMELVYKNEVEALMNQMQTLRNSFEEQIKSLKESHSRNFDDDRRRMMAMEQRMKLQEQILQSTREELRKKDFDLLDAKKYLGIAILERLEMESTKQVQRLVTALAVLPCNSPDAEAVGQAMAKWESAGEQASKAKNKFLKECERHQTMLYEGFASDSFQELIIPIIEEPAGPCPLDKLALTFLCDRENSEINFTRIQTGVPYDKPPFRIRPANLVTVGAPSPTPTSVPLPSPSPKPMSPISLGARPRETAATANGETSGALRSWPSTHSIQNSTHSSSAGIATALTNSKKLLIELKRCYPSRSDDELWFAVVTVRRNNKQSLSGLSIKKIVAMVGNILDWWPEPSEGSMGLDKFMGWAADVVAPSEEKFHGVSKATKSPAWAGLNSASKRESEKDDCCICLQSMAEPKTVLVCLHSFHTQCIRTWLSKESVCPICRKFTRMTDEFPSLK